MRRVWRIGVGCALAGMYAAIGSAQPMTWSQARDRFEATNPTLQAGRIGIDEAKAAETTAFLRPNPQWGITFDQIGVTEGGNAFSASTLGTSVSFLHERGHKRELRRDSAAGVTTMASDAQADLERNLLFTLRTAFVQVLQAKAYLALAGENLRSYDDVLRLSRDRFQAGDIAQMDLDRLDLQRVTYESDVQTSQVNLRTAKIQLLRLLNDQTAAIDLFDVEGPFDFAPLSRSLDDIRDVAMDRRPDLRAAVDAVTKAGVDHRLAVANGSTDPTFTVDAGFPSISQVWQSYQPPLRQFVGVGVAMPLRIFDRNQGEKLRTELDVTRSAKLADAARLQVFADVDTAFASVASALTLLQPYRDRYLAQAARVRDTVTFSYQRGGASLIDFLQSEQEYRSVRLGYINLVAAYLNAAAQLNLVVGEEVIP
jgi:cobalt-zinc-cadmium efflux system outer membrane protein